MSLTAPNKQKHSTKKARDQQEIRTLGSSYCGIRLVHKRRDREPYPRTCASLAAKALNEKLVLCIHIHKFIHVQQLRTMIITFPYLNFTQRSRKQNLTRKTNFFSRELSLKLCTFFCSINARGLFRCFSLNSLWNCTIFLPVLKPAATHSLTFTLRITC